jgi:hypothetical protein
MENKMINTTTTRLSSLRMAALMRACRIKIARLLLRAANAIMRVAERVMPGDVLR